VRNHGPAAMTSFIPDPSNGKGRTLDSHGAAMDSMLVLALRPCLWVVGFDRLNKRHIVDMNPTILLGEILELNTQ
jgi:hypothetical protein